MLTKKLLIGAGVIALGSTLFAHHIAVALSSSFGGEIVDKIVFYENVQTFGVPAYALGGEDHHFALTVGDSFLVTDESGASDEVFIRAEDFADPSEATMAEVLAAVTSQLTVADALELNSTLAIQGGTGGDASSITLSNGVGTALTDLSFTPGTIFGSNDVDLTLSVPLDDHHESDHFPFAHKSYVLVAGETEGVTVLDGHEIPLAVDATLLTFLRAAKIGVLPGFVGQLDEGQDGVATFPSALLTKFFPNGTPDELHFAYVVFGDQNEVVFASNRFTVQFVK